MIGKKINKKLISDEEDENDLIINNEDEDFYGENEVKSSQKKNLEMKVDNPKDSEFHSFQKEELTNESKNNDKMTNKNLFMPVPNKQNSNTNSKEITGEEKTIFSKITEDLYLDNKLYLKPKKVYFDISKAKEDNYNKLTIENYLFTCADKENSKNNKIITNFLERKTKEQNNKKIGSDPEKDDLENLKEINSDRKKETGIRHITRSSEQFIKEQKIMEERHKVYLDKLVKKHIEEEKNSIKEKPTINKQSKKIANSKKSGNKDIHLKLYEDYNIKKQKLEEKSKNEWILRENKNKKIFNEEVKQNINKLYKDYEKRKNNVKEKKIQKLNDIKNMSAVSLIEKKSNIIINRKLINIYKEVIKSLFNKNISENFYMDFSEYLSFIYKLGLVDKDYNNEESEKKNLNIITNNSLLKIFDDKINNIESEYSNKFIKNKIIFSQNILKRNTFAKSRSVERIKLDEESEFKKVKNSWIIITKNKNFSKDEKGNSRRILIFILSMYGIYKGDLNDNFIKREFPFLLQDEDKSYLIDQNITKQIYRYFLIFRNKAINNVSVKNKEKDPDKSLNLINNKKENIQNDSRYRIKTIDNYNDKINFIQNNKGFETSKSRKKMIFIQKIKNNLYKNKISNDIPSEIKDNLKNEIKENSIINHNKDKGSINRSEIEKNIDNNSQRNVNNLKKNLKPKKELVINNKINLNKGIISNSTKNIYAKNYISNKNIHTNNNLRFDNFKNVYNINKKLSPNRKFISPKNTKNIQKKPQILNKKENKLSNRNISNNEQEKQIPNLNKKSSQNKLEQSKQEKKPTVDIKRHQKEKNSSISNYIFKEDYRIKEDIESNSNLNNFEEENKEKKRISSKNFSQSEYNLENKEDIDKNTNTKDETNIKKEENSLIEKKIENNIGKRKKSKFVFKIKVKKKFIKLVINKEDDLERKINAFCEENDLDEEDKEEILEAINSNLNAL